MANTSCSRSWKIRPCTTAGLAGVTTMLASSISSISFLKSIITSLMPSIQTGNTIRLLMRSSLSNTTLSMSCPRWTSKGFYIKGPGGRSSTASCLPSSTHLRHCRSRHGGVWTTLKSFTKRPPRTILLYTRSCSSRERRLRKTY